MKKLAAAGLAAGGVIAAALGLALQGPSPQSGTASSHREAPLISEDPTADNTDLYAFRSPDDPDTLTIISNWIPAEDPAAGPMYWTFSQRARYNIYVDRNGNGRPDGNDVTFRVTFKNKAPVAVLQNTQQTYTVTRNGRVVARGQTPPNNIGDRSTPKYLAIQLQSGDPA